MKYYLEINIVSKCHVFGVDAEDLQTSCRVRDTNVDFMIEVTETPQCRVDRVGPVSGSDHNNIRTSFETIHESEELGNNTTFNFAVGLV